MKSALLSLIVTIAIQGAPLTFTHSDYSFGEGHVTGAATLADVNGDKHPDILIVNGVIADPYLAKLLVMLGDGAGQFGAPTEFSVGPNPFGVTAVDFNHDGAVDAAIPFGTGESNGITILLGDGRGSFGSRRDYGFGLVIPALAVGDLDADGELDIAAASIYTDSVFVLRGRGDGSFENPVEYAVAGSWPQAIALADLDNNGRLDIVTGDFVTNTVSLLRARPTGGYSSTRIAVGRNPFAVLAADFNGDGNADIIAVNDFDFTYSILLGHGDGSFDRPRTFDAGGFPEGAVAADFNRDGRLDFAIGNSIAFTVSIFIGRGDGTFESAAVFPGGNNAYMLATGDIDHDDDLDLVIANAGGVSVLRNDTFFTPKRRGIRPR